jgi:hypothetical protein
MNETTQPAVAGQVDRGVRPRAWIGPSGQTMPDEIYVAWAKSYPADAQHFSPLFDQAALDAAVAAERERLARDVAGLHMAQSINNQNHPSAWDDGVDAALDVIRGA